MKVFKKELMIKRLENEGLADQITEEVKEIMNNLDGQEATENNWDNIVNGSGLWYVIGKNGKGEYVNPKDCILKY